MEWFNNLLNWFSNLNFLNLAYQNHLLIQGYLYLILIMLLLGIIYLIKTQLELSQIQKQIKSGKFDEVNFLKGIKQKYQDRLTGGSEQINLSSFIDDYFASKKGRLIKNTNIIKKSGAIFVLLGFFTGFIMLLIPLLGLDLTKLQGISDLINRLSHLLTAFESAFYAVVIGIAAAIIISLLNRFWDVEETLNEVKNELKEYIQVDIRTQRKADLSQQTAAVNKLADIMENGFARIEELFEDTLIDSLGDIEELLLDIREVLKKSAYTAEELELIREIDFQNEEIQAVLKQIATASHSNYLIDYPEEELTREEE